MGAPLAAAATLLCCWVLAGTGVNAQRQGFRTTSENGCPKMRVVEANVETSERALEFQFPENDRLRVSRCFGNGPPECDRDETQLVADAYCQGVGFQFASFWRATTVNDTVCYPELGGIDQAGCDNVLLEGRCQGFETIVCAGAKILRAAFDGEGVSGIVEFVQNSSGSASQVVIKLSGLPRQGVSLEIREKPAQDDCSRVGPLIFCDFGEVCVGDLPSRLGMIEGPNVDDTLEDQEIPLIGGESIEGTSVVIRNKKDKAIACATLQPRVSIKLPDRVKLPEEDTETGNNSSGSDGMGE